jgi:hypothetical protein
MKTFGGTADDVEDMGTMTPFPETMPVSAASFGWQWRLNTASVSPPQGPQVFLN